MILKNSLIFIFYVFTAFLTYCKGENSNGRYYRIENSEPFKESYHVKKIKAKSPLIGIGVEDKKYFKVQNKDEVLQIQQNEKNARSKRLFYESTEAAQILKKNPKSLPSADVKKIFKEFILEYVDKYKGKSALNYKDITAYGSLIITEEDLGSFRKSTKIDELNFQKTFKSKLFNDFKFILNESEFESWDVNKSKNNFIISISANLITYDFTFGVINGKINLNKINKFLDT